MTAVAAAVEFPAGKPSRTWSPGSGRPHAPAGTVRPEPLHQRDRQTPAAPQEGQRIRQLEHFQILMHRPVGEQVQLQGFPVRIGILGRRSPFGLGRFVPAAGPGDAKTLAVEAVSRPSNRSRRACAPIAFWAAGSTGRRPPAPRDISRPPRGAPELPGGGLAPHQHGDPPDRPCRHRAPCASSGPRTTSSLPVAHSRRCARSRNAGATQPFEGGWGRTDRRRPADIQPATVRQAIRAPRMPRNKRQIPFAGAIPTRSGSAQLHRLSVPVNPEKADVEVVAGNSKLSGSPPKRRSVVPAQTPGGRPYSA